MRVRVGVGEGADIETGTTCHAIQHHRRTDNIKHENMGLALAYDFSSRENRPVSEMTGCPVQLDDCNNHLNPSALECGLSGRTPSHPCTITPQLCLTVESIATKFAGKQKEQANTQASRTRRIKCSSHNARSLSPLVPGFGGGGGCNRSAQSLSVVSTPVWSSLCNCCVSFFRGKPYAHRGKKGRRTSREGGAGGAGGKRRER